MPKAVSKKATESQEEELRKEGLEKEESHRVKGGTNFFWAFALIAAGVIFLLNNFGILPWGIWTTILRFWPVVLIIFGLEMILENSFLGRLVIALVSLAAVIIIFALVFSSPSVNLGYSLRGWPSIRSLPGIFGNPRTQLGEKREKKILISRADYPKVKRRRVSVKSGLSRLIILGDKDAELIEVNSEYFTNFGEPQLEVESGDDLLTVDLTNEFESGRLWPGFREDIKQTVSFGSFDLPMDLDLEIGAGKLTADFADLILERLGVNVGAGSAELKMTEKSIPKNGVKVNVGAGSVELTLPKNIGLKIRYDIGIGNLKVNDQNMKGNGIYATESYDQAQLKLELEADVGVGSLKIKFD